MPNSSLYNIIILEMIKFPLVIYLVINFIFLLYLKQFFK
jgi:hypothetical protein